MTATTGASLSLLHEPGSVFEIRILNTARAGTVSGYFDDPEAAAKAIARYDHKVPAVYVTLNPVNPALLARSANHLKERVRETSSDTDVVSRRWLLIDVDYHRPAGISATDEEVAAAGKVAYSIRAHLTAAGWPGCVLTMSGNGWHLLYRVDLPNDEASRDLVRRTLEVLAGAFDASGKPTDPGVRVDTTVFNAARIAKVPDTWVCKGDDLPDRPHRQSRIEDQPGELQVVDVEHLRAIAGPEPAAAKPASSSYRGNGHVEFDVEEWMARYGLRVRKHKADAGGDLWELETCPFNAEHVLGEPFVRRDVSGSLSAGCQHASCFNTWHELRERFEPEYDRSRQAVATTSPPTQQPASEQATAPDHASPFYINWATFCAADHDEAEWDYPDVLARGRGHALYAPAGQGKSLFSLWLSVEMTRLHPDLHVHYYDYEMTEADLHERLDDMGVLDPAVLERLHYALLPDLPPLDTPQGSVAMMERIDAVRAAHPTARHATVIDTMGRAVAGEENDADTYRDFSRLTGMQLRRRCITWVRCDHAGKDPSKMQRGSSAKNDDVDVVWLLVPTNSGITLKRDKARMGWVPERVVFAKIDDPLRYERRTDDWPEGTGELANLLDRLEVAHDATSKVAIARLREFGEPRRRQLVLAALRFRSLKIDEAGTAPRNRPEPLNDGSGNHEDFGF